MLQSAEQFCAVSPDSQIPFPHFRGGPQSVEHVDALSPRVRSQIRSPQKPQSERQDEGDSFGEHTKSPQKPQSW
jgi:hypothetical protein